MMRSRKLREVIGCKLAAWDEAAEALVEKTRSLSHDGVDDLAVALLIDELRDTLREVAGLRPKRTWEPLR